MLRSVWFLRGEIVRPSAASPSVPLPCTRAPDLNQEPEPLLENQHESASLLARLRRFIFLGHYDGLGLDLFALPVCTRLLATCVHHAAVSEHIRELGVCKCNIPNIAGIL